MADPVAYMQSHDDQILRDAVAASEYDDLMPKTRKSCAGTDAREIERAAPDV